MTKRITNLVLAEKIDGIEKLFVNHNKNQDDRIKNVEGKTDKNTVAIAGLKGMVVGVSALVTFAVNAVIAFFTFKGTGA